ncbi:MAG: hypothetical protein ACRDOO_15950, partial [Actinomadura sp.]
MAVHEAQAQAEPRPADHRDRAQLVQRHLAADAPVHLAERARSDPHGDIAIVEEPVDQGEQQPRSREHLAHDRERLAPVAAVEGHGVEPDQDRNDHSHRQYAHERGRRGVPPSIRAARGGGFGQWLPPGSSCKPLLVRRRDVAAAHRVRALPGPVH